MREPPGLFITGTDTSVGKTYITALVARALRQAGHRVGVYKPVATGCRREGERLACDDAVALAEAAGRLDELEHVCPQRFLAPLAPHLAAEAEGEVVNVELLRRGINYWRAESDIVLVEGAGGLMSPVTDELFVADLAAAFGYPLVVVARNALGTIHQTLATLIAAAAFEEGLQVAGIVLNQPQKPAVDDLSVESNRAELTRRAVPPVLAEVRHGARDFDPPVDWWALAEASR
jgi:dethiobiotin synthetase